MSSSDEGLAGPGRKPVRWVMLALAVCLFAAAHWLNSGQPAPDVEAGPVTSEASVQPRPVLTVDSAAVVETVAPDVVEVSGTLAARRMVAVAAEVEGRVERVAAEDHSRVAAGQLLVELDRALFEAAVKRARAGLIRARAGERLARAEFERQRDLLAGGVSSGSQYERAESDAETGSALVAESQAALAEAETRLAKTRIEAPFAGTVSAIAVDPGAYLRPGDPVVRLADLSEIEIEVGVGEQEVLALRDGDRVRVGVDALPDRWFDGRVERVGRLPDPSTRKYPVPVRVPNPDEQLLPGMLGTVRFELGEKRASIRIPRRAVVREFDLDHVFVLVPEADGSDVATVELRRVALAPIGFRPDLVEIRSGLVAGERIAISELRALTQGARVIRRERQPAELAGPATPSTAISGGAEP